MCTRARTMSLNTTTIEGLKPKASRYTVTDGRGLVLEVFPTGGKPWHYRYRLNGNQERVTLGRYPALSLSLARRERDKRETMVALGQSPAKHEGVSSWCRLTSAFGPGAR